MSGVAGSSGELFKNMAAIAGDTKPGRFPKALAREKVIPASDGAISMWFALNAAGPNPSKPKMSVHKVMT